MFVRRSINWMPPKVSPTRYVYDQGALKETTLLIHGVHQSLSDIALTHQSGASVIHCPKSNAKLGAGVAPLTEWLKVDGLKLGIGTDSAVSNNSIDLFEEMRFGLLMQRGKHEMVEGVTAAQMLELATVRGAKAMGLENTVGSLRPGLRADIIAVDLNALSLFPARSPLNTLVYSATARDVKLTIIDGEVCYDDLRFVGLDTDTLRVQAAALAHKLSLIGN